MYPTRAWLRLSQNSESQPRLVPTLITVRIVNLALSLSLSSRLYTFFPMSKMFQSYCEGSIDSIIFYPAENYPNGLKCIEIGFNGAAEKSHVKEDQLDDTTMLR